MTRTHRTKASLASAASLRGAREAKMPRRGATLRVLAVYTAAVVTVASNGVSVASAEAWSSSSSASGSGNEDVGANTTGFTLQSSSSGYEAANANASGASSQGDVDTITFESLFEGDGSNATGSQSQWTTVNESSSASGDLNATGSSSNDTITFESLLKPEEGVAVPQLKAGESLNATASEPVAKEQNATTEPIQRIPIEELASSTSPQPNTTVSLVNTTAQATVQVDALAATLSSSSSSSSSSSGSAAVGETEAPVTPVIEIHGVPSPPTLVTAAAFDSSAVVSWEVPDDDGLDPILEYEVAWIDEVEGKVAGTKAIAHTPGSVVIVDSKNTNSTKDGPNENELVPTTVTIASLINGRSYSFKVRAKNVNGYSTWSAKSLAVSPLHPPDLCGRVTCSGHGTCFPSYEADRSNSRKLSEEVAASSVEGHCICRAGYNPPDCSVKNEATKYVWKVTEWGDCSNGCGGGQRTREATCWDALLDQKAAEDSLCPSKKPLLTRICNGMECGSKLVTVRYQVETSYDEVLFSPESWEAFELAFTTEVAAALQIPRTRLEISAVKRGSIVVFFQILPASRVGERSLSDLWERLQLELGNASSTLRSRGTFARRVETTGVKLSYSIADVSVAGGAGDISIPGLIGTVAVLCSFVALFGLFLRKRHERIMKHSEFTLQKESAAGQNVLHTKRSEMKPMGIRTMA